MPGHDPNEEGLFPHPGDDIVIKLGVWKWKRPEWADSNPEFRGKKWLKIERDEIDEWGTVWHRDGQNSTMGHPGKPSLSDWKDLDSYLEKYTPKLDEKKRFSIMIRLAKIVGRNKYRMPVLGNLGPFQKASDMVGFSKFLISHRTHPEKVKQLLKHLTDWYIQCMDMWIKYGAKPHGFLLYDDLGEQNGPYFSPKQFEEFYEPVYGRLYQAAHDRNCEFHHHICGKIDKIIPSLIKWELDALELDAPRMTGYPSLQPFRGKIMFWGCVNIQSIYPQGTPQECEREVWHMMRNLGTREGGFGAYFYPQTSHIRVPKINVKAFLKGLKKYGAYSKIPASWWEFPVTEKWSKNNVPQLPTLSS